MLKKIIAALVLTLILLLSNNLFADVAVGLIPLKGNDKNRSKIENYIKETLSKSGGISIVADKMLKDILKIHEKAQSLGSAYHDISKLKTAEYLISGAINSGKLLLTVVDVNKGTEIFNKQIKINVRNRYYAIRSLCKDLRDSILLQASSKRRDIPEEAEPYMEILNNFVSSLKSGKKAPYKYVVIYYKGKYRFPDDKNKDIRKKADLLIKVVRPNLIRSKLTYLFLKANPPWVYVNVIATKFGKKTKHQFGIIELDNGSLGIGIYKPMD